MYVTKVKPACRGRWEIHMHDGSGNWTVHRFRFRWFAAAVRDWHMNSNKIFN